MRNRSRWYVYISVTRGLLWALDLDLVFKALKVDPQIIGNH